MDIKKLTKGELRRENMSLREEIEVLEHQKSLLDQQKNFDLALEGIAPNVQQKLETLRNENLFLSKESSKMIQVCMGLYTSD